MLPETIYSSSNQSGPTGLWLSNHQTDSSSMAKLLKIAKTKDVPPGQAATFTIEGQKIALFNVEGARRRLRLHEKGGKEHEMPVHHLLEELLNEYIVAAGLQSGQPLFQSVNSLGTAVTGRALNRYNAWAAIRRRAKAAGFLTPVGCHTWRATGITIYLENDGRLEHAQQMAGHESPRTTKLYDRTKDEITLSEVERIRL